MISKSLTWICNVNETRFIEVYRTGGTSVVMCVPAIGNMAVFAVTGTDSGDNPEDILLRLIDQHRVQLMQADPERLDGWVTELDTTYTSGKVYEIHDVLDDVPEDAKKKVAEILDRLGKK